MNDAIPSAGFASLRKQAWNRAVLASPGELDLRIDAGRIEGEIPEALRGGRLLSNGPGWTRMGDMNLHPFDSHGYVRAFELQPDGSCRLRARFVGTRVYRDEAASQRFMHRGFATNLPGFTWKNMGLGAGIPRNVANTTIMRWGDRLLAGWEAGEPHALDADSLETRGPETFSGVIAGQATLAHMRRDQGLERLVACSVAGRESRFTFRELDRYDRVVATRVATLEGMRFTHDFAFTPNWYLLGDNPLRLDPIELAKTMIGRSTLLRSVATDDARPGALHLVPRGEGPVRTIRLPGPAFVVHFGNAFEREGAVIVDACVFSRFEFGEEFGHAGPSSPFDPALPDARGPQRLVRITVAAGASEASWRPLSAHGVDFPRFHPDHEGRETPLLFGAARADTRYSDPFDSLIRVDLRDPERPVDLWTAPDHVFVGEPSFVPGPARDDAGHVLALLSDGLRERSTLAIFDATALAKGPLAQVPMPLLPVAFHGEWDPTTPTTRSR